ncbi:MAG: adenosylcobinamide-GDP ribazoletransferase [Bacilli bacterium]
MKNIFLAISFFTSIKMPNVEFKQNNYRYLPILLPFVGLLIGSIGYGVYTVLNLVEISPFLKAITITIYFAFITGGLHLDGLLDTVDSHYSRRDLERRLEIMHTSTIGAFACIYAILFFILKVAVLNELILNDYLGYSIILIPIISRSFAGILISSARFASDNGLANMYKYTVKKWFNYVIAIQLLVVITFGYVTDIDLIIIVVACMLYCLVYLKFMYKNFNGITGDILGAFIETSELVMLLAMLGLMLW